MSQIALSKSPRPAAAGKESLEALLAVVPTAEREFSTIDSATAFVRIYNQVRGGEVGPVAIASRILDGSGKTVLGRTDTLEPDRFRAAARAADFRFDLPLDGLDPGEYLLSMTATQGPAAGAMEKPVERPGDETRREVRFVVR
jgi:hypothetical protein